MKYPLEEEEQAAFVEWLEHMNLKFTAIPNSTWTPSFAQKAKNKKVGLRPGFPDLVIITPKGLLFVEMKRKRGSKTYPEQLEWKRKLNELSGVQSEICFGADQAIDFVEQFL